ncbi:MAG: flagellar basal body-associated FliL family protein [Clostridium sp.]
MATDKENKKGGKGKTIILVVIALIVVGVVSFGATYMVLNNKAEATEPEIKEAYCNLEEIMVNLNDEGPKRYLKTSVSISYDSKNKELAAEIEENIVAVRDATIYYFKTKTTNDFKAENEAVLKKGLADKINGVLKTGDIIDVKFSNLITQ